MGLCCGKKVKNTRKIHKVLRSYSQSSMDPPNFQSLKKKNSSQSFKPFEIPNKNIYVRPNIAGDNARNSSSCCCGKTPRKKNIPQQLSLVIKRRSIPTFINYEVKPKHNMNDVISNPAKPPNSIPSEMKLSEKKFSESIISMPTDFQSVSSKKSQEQTTVPNKENISSSPCCGCCYKSTNKYKNPRKIRKILRTHSKQSLILPKKSDEYLVTSKPPINKQLKKTVPRESITKSSDSFKPNVLKSIDTISPINNVPKEKEIPRGNFSSTKPLFKSNEGNQPRIFKSDWNKTDKKITICRGFLETKTKRKPPNLNYTFNYPYVRPQLMVYNAWKCHNLCHMSYQPVHPCIHICCL